MFSILPGTVRPGSTSPKPGSLSIRNVVMFLYTESAPVSVFTSTATRFEDPPLVSHIFWPLIVHSPSPVATAFEVIAATSDPQPGSDIENAPRTSPVAMRGRYLFFCLLYTSPSPRDR